MAQDPPLTAGEKAQIAWYVGRMCKRSLAGENVSQRDLQRKVDAILARAREREQQPKKTR